MSDLRTLADLSAAFRLYAVCEDCHRIAAIDLAAMMQREGHHYPIERLRMRLKCTQCRRRTQTIRIVYVGPQSRAAGFRYARTTVGRES